MGGFGTLWISISLPFRLRIHFWIRPDVFRRPYVFRRLEIRLWSKDFGLRLLFRDVFAFTKSKKEFDIFSFLGLGILEPGALQHSGVRTASGTRRLPSCIIGCFEYID